MSHLDELYKEIILDHYHTPRNRGELASPPAHRVEGFNPLCGDEVTLYLELRDGRLADIKITGHGCSISQASASLMGAAVKGRSLEEVRETIERFKRLMTVTEARLDAQGEPEPGDLRALGELAALSGVVKFPVRIKCAMLPWSTLAQGLDEAAA